MSRQRVRTRWSQASLRLVKRSAPLRSLALSTCLIAGLAGCASLPIQPLVVRGGSESRLSREELATELSAFASRFAGVVSTAAEEIVASHRDDSTIRRRALLWTVRLTPLVQEAAFLPNPRSGYLRVITVTRMMLDYLTEGDGHDLFAVSQPIAVSAAKTLHAAALGIGENFLSPEQREEMLVEVGSLAKRFPIQGTQFSLVRANQAVEEAQQNNIFETITTLPLAPFRVFRSVDTGAAAIRNFNLTARRFSTVVAALPESLRAEMQLLLLDADDLRTSRRGIAAVESAAASADRASLAMAGFVEDLRSVLRDEARVLFDQSQEALDQATLALEQARGLAGPLQESTTQIREASVLWREILGPHESRPRDPEAPTFDVREWERAAEAIGAAAAELRVLADDLQGHSFNAQLDGLFWRGAALLLLFFGLLLGYRILATRLTRAG